MPVFGLNNGMIPIIAYNLGAKQKDRMLKTIRLAMIYAVGLMIIGIVVDADIVECAVLECNITC